MLVAQPKKSLSCPLGCLVDGVHDCYGANKLSFPVPTLTISGELDGVVRLARLAEAHYTQSSLPAADFPVVVVAGMNHAALLGSAGLPAAVSGTDLRAEISGAAAIKAVADSVAAFVQVHASSATVTGSSVSEITTTGARTLARLHETSGALVDAAVVSLVKQEGNWFLTGHDDEHGGSAWAGAAQEMMAGELPASYSWSTSNEFRLLSDEDKIPP
jgi:hypothetical protein